MKRRGVTAVITAEQGEHGLTRHGLEEYVSDCVIRLDNQVLNQIATRRLRVVKYRGSTHGPNEYPFIINQTGLSVLPVSSARLDHRVSQERVPSGVAGLDSMLGGGGFFRGSSVLVSGASGTGKSSLAAHFADASCRRGDRCVYFAFEESPQQIVRNMQSIGLQMASWIAADRLVIESARPSTHGLETHLTQIFQAVEQSQPASVVIDPISSLRGNHGDVCAVLLRAIDMLKARGITAFLTSLSDGASGSFGGKDGISSLIMDSWLWLTNLESNGERNRGLYVMKSRGMKHSNQIREFILTDEGVHLVDAYLGPAGVLTESARLTQEATDSWAERQRALDLDLDRRAIAKRRRLLEQQMAELAFAIEDEAAEQVRLDEKDGAFQRTKASDRREMAVRRGVLS